MLIIKHLPGRHDQKAHAGFRQMTKEEAEKLIAGGTMSMADLTSQKLFLSSPSYRQTVLDAVSELEAARAVLRPSSTYSITTFNHTSEKTDEDYPVVRLETKWGERRLSVSVSPLGTRHADKDGRMSFYVQDIKSGEDMLNEIEKLEAYVKDQPSWRITASGYSSMFNDVLGALHDKDYHIGTQSLSHVQNGIERAVEDIIVAKDGASTYAAIKRGYKPEAGVYDRLRKKLADVPGMLSSGDYEIDIDSFMNARVTDDMTGASLPLLTVFTAGEPYNQPTPVTFIKHYDGTVVKHLPGQHDQDKHAPTTTGKIQSSELLTEAKEYITQHTQGEYAASEEDLSRCYLQQTDESARNRRSLLSSAQTVADVAKILNVGTSYEGHNDFSTTATPVTSAGAASVVIYRYLNSGDAYQIMAVSSTDDASRTSTKLYVTLPVNAKERFTEKDLDNLDEYCQDKDAFITLVTPDMGIAATRDYDLVLSSALMSKLAKSYQQFAINQAAGHAEREKIRDGFDEKNEGVCASFRSQLDYNGSNVLDSSDWWSAVLRDDEVTGAKIPLTLLLQTSNESAEYVKKFNSSGVVKHLAGQHDQQHHAGKDAPALEDLPATTKLLEELISKYQVRDSRFVPIDLQIQGVGAAIQARKNALAVIASSIKIYNALTGSVLPDNSLSLYATDAVANAEIILSGTSVRVHAEYIRAGKKPAVSCDVEYKSKGTDENTHAVAELDEKLKNISQTLPSMPTLPSTLTVMSRNWEDMYNMGFDWALTDDPAIRNLFDGVKDLVTEVIAATETANSAKRTLARYDDPEAFKQFRSQLVKDDRILANIPVDDIPNTKLVDPVTLSEIPLALLMNSEGAIKTFVKTYNLPMNKHLAGRHNQTTHGRKDDYSAKHIEDLVNTYVAKTSTGTGVQHPIFLSNLTSLSQRKGVVVAITEALDLAGSDGMEELRIMKEKSGGGISISQAQHPRSVEINVYFNLPKKKGRSVQCQGSVNVADELDVKSAFSLHLDESDMHGTDSENYPSVYSEFERRCVGHDVLLVIIPRVNKLGDLLDLGGYVYDFSENGGLDKLEYLEKDFVRSIASTTDVKGSAKLAANLSKRVKTDELALARRFADQLGVTIGAADQYIDMEDMLTASVEDDLVTFVRLPMITFLSDPNIAKQGGGEVEKQFHRINLKHLAGRHNQQHHAPHNTADAKYSVAAVNKLMAAFAASAAPAWLGYVSNPVFRKNFVDAVAGAQHYFPDKNTPLSVGANTPDFVSASITFEDVYVTSSSKFSNGGYVARELVYLNDIDNADSIAAKAVIENNQEAGDYETLPGLLEKFEDLCTGRQASLSVIPRSSKLWSLIGKGYKLTVGSIADKPNLGAIVISILTKLSAGVPDLERALGRVRKSHAAKLSDSLYAQLAKHGTTDANGVTIDLDDIANIELVDDVITQATLPAFLIFGAREYDVDGFEGWALTKEFSADDNKVTKHLPGRHSQALHAGQHTRKNTVSADPPLDHAGFQKYLKKIFEMDSDATKVIEGDLQTEFEIHPAAENGPLHTALRKSVIQLADVTEAITGNVIGLTSGIKLRMWRRTEDVFDGFAREGDLNPEQTLVKSVSVRTGPVYIRQQCNLADSEHGNRLSIDVDSTRAPNWSNDETDDTVAIVKDSSQYVDERYKDGQSVINVVDRNRGLESELDWLAENEFNVSQLSAQDIYDAYSRMIVDTKETLVELTTTDRRRVIKDVIVRKDEIVNDFADQIFDMMEQNKLNIAYLPVDYFVNMRLTDRLVTGASFDAGPITIAYGDPLRYRKVQNWWIDGED